MKWTLIIQLVLSFSSLLGASSLSAFADEEMDFGEESIADSDGDELPFSLNYFNILYGPSLKKPSSYQPAPDGTPDHNRPVIIRNFLTVQHNISEMVSMAGSLVWVWQPVMGQSLQLQDPFIRMSYNSIFYSKGWNLYADVRGHFPITNSSRENDLRFGLQFFQALTYTPAASRWMLGLYTSQRLNFYGNSGFGNDTEFYFAPNLMYQLSPTVSLTLLYELQRNHFIGEKPFPLYSDGTTLEPGVSWMITPNIMINPYLNIITEKKVSLATTSIGMMMNIALL